MNPLLCEGTNVVPGLVTLWLAWCEVVAPRQLIGYVILISNTCHITSMYKASKVCPKCQIASGAHELHHSTTWPVCVRLISLCQWAWTLSSKIILMVRDGKSSRVVRTLLVLGSHNSYNTGVWGSSPSQGNIPVCCASDLFSMNNQFHQIYVHAISNNKNKCPYYP